MPHSCAMAGRWRPALVEPPEAATTTQAFSAKEGLELLAHQQFDVLVSDIGMPEKDGFRLIQEIRQSQKPYKDIPAIALTAFGRSEDRRDAMVSGFDVFLTKPIDSSELAATVARVLTRS